MYKIIRSVRFRFTINGGILGFGVGALGYLLEWRFLSDALNALPASGFPPFFDTALLTAFFGTASGAVWGVRKDGTRYLFGRIRRLARDYKWQVEYNKKTTKPAQELLISHTIPAPNKTLILVYNSMFGMPLDMAEGQLPPGCAITTNRRYLRHAAAVAFHLPTLRGFNRITRYPNQLWAAWFMESAGQYPRINDKKFMANFDITISYRRNGDIWTPYWFPEFYEMANVKQQPKSKDKLIAMFFSYLGEMSGRNTYVEELIRYIDIHSYGRFLRNRPLPNDKGRDTKLGVISQYKFNLAYENTLERDYVTEKFFNPLEVGCVPIYMGAPNVDDFAPGENCYINAAHFSGPKALAEYLLELNEDDDAYNAYHAWRKQPPRSQYLKFYEEQQVPFLLRLCRLVQERNIC